MLWVKEIISDDAVVLEDRAESGDLLSEITKSYDEIEDLIKAGNKIKGYTSKGVYQDYSYAFYYLMRRMENMLTRGVIYGIKSYGVLVWSMEDNKLTLKIDEIEDKVQRIEPCRLDPIAGISSIVISVDYAKSEFKWVQVRGDKRLRTFVVPEGSLYFTRNGDIRKGLGRC